MTSMPLHWRVALLGVIIFAPLAYLLLLRAPIPQDGTYHMLADMRTCMGVRNFGNVASNLAFLLVGVTGFVWCSRRLRSGARHAWMAFFAGVALVFFGSSYYHTTPNDDTLLWDRLPMTLAFMGLFVALVSEHMGDRYESRLLLPALALGIASVVWWRVSGDLRVYVWVQGAPLLAIPFLIALFPGRFTHRSYLLLGLGWYVLAKVAEHHDQTVYALTASLVSGHSLKHVLAAMAPLSLLLMLQRRQPNG